MARKKKKGEAQSAEPTEATPAGSAYPPLPTALVVLGSFLVLLSVWFQFQELRLTRFPYAEARVVKVEPVQVQKHRGQLPSIWEGRIHYQFEVEGQTIESHACGSDGSAKVFSSQNAAMKHLTLHPKGSALSVQYDPENPSRCFRELELTLLPLKLGGFAALMVLAGIVLLLQEYRRSPR